MTPFLKKLAEDLSKRYNENISNICIVLPTKRAGLFLENYLSGCNAYQIIAPSIYNMEEFIRNASSYNFPDKLFLISALYDIYKKYNEFETFSGFYPWGEVILNDFDEIDRNLIPAEDIFRIIREQINVEEKFDFTAADVNGFNEFWSKFSGRELSKMQGEFIKTYEVLGKIYHEFRRELFEKNIAYEGMAFRKLYEEVKTNVYKPHWDKIVFAGFNRLTGAELGIMHEMAKQDMSELYWDADDYYLNDETQEAGTYLRDNIKKLDFHTSKWIENKLTSDKKNIKMIGAPLQAGQAKALGNYLSKMIEEGRKIDENTAVILPDENLLIPVLHSIPSGIEQLNITMGFPFRNSTLYNLLELLRSLHKNVRKTGNGSEFHYKDVIHVFMNPYVKFFGASAAYEIVNSIKKNNTVFISREKLSKSNLSIFELIEKIFLLPENGKAAINYLYGVLDLLSESIDKSTEDFVKFEREFFFTVYENLNHLTDIFTKTEEKIETETFWKIFFEVVRNLRIPFTGEPLHGLQLMGMLETRSLDFENLFIMSMNEGIIPAGEVKNSFIPYSLRKAFKLPTLDNEDCMAAYNFYRLLQRAKNIYLIYNTEVDVFSSGEKSRLLLQVETELVKKNPNIKFENIITEAEVPRFTLKAISIPKSMNIINKLNGRKHYSPSDLIIYISCSLRFYLRSIAGLDIQQDVEEFFSPSSFGNIVHELAQILYKDYTGKVIDKKVIESLRNNVEQNYDVLLQRAFKSIEGLKDLNPDLTGKNLLYKNVIKKLLLKILEKDGEGTPFTITELESGIAGKISIKVNGSKTDINLYGRIDRVDSTNEQIRIIDYKTGLFKMNTAGKKSIDEYFEYIFTDSAYKENFQAYFYAYLYQKKHKKPVKIAIYPLQKINDGLSYFNQDIIPPEELELFEQKLMQLMTELFSADVPFAQTDDKKNCQFCIYKSICYRE